MITKEQNITKYCCLYASDFHLEMILLPYIKNKMYKSNVIVFTENSLKDSLKILLERTNLKLEDKNEIMNIKNWNTCKLEEKYKENEEYTIIINGNNDYRNKIHKELENIPNCKFSIIDCYDLNKINISREKLQSEYERCLNTVAL